MTITLNGTTGLVNDATSLSYTGTLTGGTGVVNLGSGQVYKDASGNLGVGTTTPVYKLDVHTTSASGVRITSATSDTYIVPDFYGSGVTSILTGSGGGKQIAFGNSSTERMRIDSSGNLLVGTTSYAYVNSNNQILGGGQAIIQHQSGTASGASYCDFTLNAGRIGNIAQNGTTAISYNTSSDYRLKEAIAPMTGALAKVALLKPCTYKWKVDGSDGQGFIAHELAEVEAGCVTGEKDAVDAEGNPQYQGIDTSFLVATLTAAIQELKAIVDAQAARITALEGTAA